MYSEGLDIHQFLVKIIINVCKVNGCLYVHINVWNQTHRADLRSAAGDNISADRRENELKLKETPEKNKEEKEDIY